MTRKRYDHITTLVDDPAQYAVEHDLVGRHEPEVRAMIGAWRWPIVHEVRDALVRILTHGTCIDFGGSAGPIGYGATIVDPESSETPTLFDVPGPVDLIFTCHTLEHLKDIRLAVLSIIHKIRPGGTLIAVVPSWQVEKLRAENWPNHYQTFCLTPADAPMEYLRLDQLWGPHMTVVYGRDDGANILLVAVRAR